MNLKRAGGGISCKKFSPFLPQARIPPGEKKQIFFKIMKD
jgi:hypothetical protein